jgi:hypothetical protein
VSTPNLDLLVFRVNETLAELADAGTAPDPPIVAVISRDMANALEQETGTWWLQKITIQTCVGTVDVRQSARVRNFDDFYVMTDGALSALF